MEKKFIGIRVPGSVYNKVKDIAYWNRVPINHFILEALQSHIGQYERERGEPYPDRKLYKGK